uniref:Secreted protein n=1 Tax=Anopheles darlingi TaxID=43151 RepID=A0A2M4DFK0_ANODA
MAPHPSFHCVVSLLLWIDIDWPRHARACHCHHRSSSFGLHCSIINCCFYAIRFHFTSCFHLFLIIMPCPSFRKARLALLSIPSFFHVSPGMKKGYSPLILLSIHYPPTSFIRFVVARLVLGCPFFSFFVCFSFLPHLSVCACA